MKKFLSLFLLLFVLTGCSGKVGQITNKIDEVMNNNVPNTAGVTADGKNVGGLDQQAMAVDDLLRSNTVEGKEVTVVGRVGGCFEVKKTADNIGAVSGCKLQGDQGEIIADNFDISKSKNEVVVVTGKVGYCGGKNKLKVICSLLGAKLKK